MDTEIRVRRKNGTGSIGTSGRLFLGSERSIVRSASGGTLKFSLGKVIPNDPFGDSFAVTLTRGSAQGTDFTGTYPGAAIREAKVISGTNGVFGDIDPASSVVITAYDPIINAYSGRIDRVQSTYEGTFDAPVFFTSVTGRFENIPATDQ